jgi:hypothetical protein
MTIEINIDYNESKNVFRLSDGSKIAQDNHKALGYRD